MSQVKHVAAGEGRRFTVIGGDVITLKAVGGDTDEWYAVIETLTPPQAGPPPHIHLHPWGSLAQHFHTKTGGCLTKNIVERGERQLSAKREIEVGGVVTGQFLAATQRKQVVESPG